MALFLNQNGQRTQIQTKIAADLEDRLQQSSAGNGEQERVPTMLEDTKKSTGRSLFWMGVALIVVVGAFIFWLLVSGGI